MKLITYYRNKVEETGILLDENIIPLDVLNDVFGWHFPNHLDEIFKSDSFTKLAHNVKNINLDMSQFEGYDSYQLTNIKIAPLYRHPPKIWGIGLNYRDHAADLEEKTPSLIPASFMKADTTIIGPGETIQLPKVAEKTTGEAELGIIIGKKCKNIHHLNWLEAVAGFTCIIDMTAESILRKNPRYLTLSKNFDTFFSFGPVLITPEEVMDINSLQVATILNGEIHAKNMICNMTFPPDFLVSFHSEVMTLLPGDIISTGTPRAVEIKPGDNIGCSISGFPILNNPVAG
ncbi:MAG: fumarylacetoacetate hydrolase family protein [Candidatus Lokiarchaeota archaeon]|nr:fumarylacetoacetate hydrolase family protein [Candidatus Lokiarchaeota archaeon]